MSVKIPLLIAGMCALALIASAIPSPLFPTPFLHNAVVAQTANTPTPVPTAVPTPEQPDDSGAQNLLPLEGKLNPLQYPNMDPGLNRIVREAEDGGFTAQAMTAAASGAPISSEQSVAVTLYITEGYADAISAYLSDNGASPRNIGADYIEAYIPVSLLPDASQQEGVIIIRTIIPPRPAQGAVVSEGAAAHGAPAWNAAGIRGQGAKIGIIDVGFEGFSDLMGTELPATVQARCYTDVGVFTSNLENCTDSEDHESSRKHGTAVTEAIFDIAPEATYYVANTSSYGDLLNAVQWMISHDVNIINHSVGWVLLGPGDGTSPFANSPLSTVDAAVAGGILWVNSAGNNARTRWTGAFTDTNSDGWHEFSSTGDMCADINIELQPRVGSSIQLRWDDSWLGASSDLDLFLIPIAPGRVFSINDAIEVSEAPQDGTADTIPFEFISIEYGDIPDGAYCLAVRKHSGAAPAWLQLQAWGVRELEHSSPAFSIGNPAESRNDGMLAVGAARWSIINTIEPFSSRGPTNDGRIKPDIVGADGGKSVTYRSDRQPDGRWLGTSQAAPHVTGIAALVKQRYPEYVPQRIAQYLKTHAEERGTIGADNIWGHGFAYLPASDVPSTSPSPSPTPAPSYDITKYACNQDDLAHLGTFMLASESGPNTYTANYYGITGSYTATWDASQTGLRAVCFATQYDTTPDARWHGLSYSAVTQRVGAIASVNLIAHRQAFPSPSIGYEMLALQMEYQIDGNPSRLSEVKFIDAATNTVASVRFIVREADDYPDIEDVAGVARNIEARALPDDSQNQSARDANIMSESFALPRPR